MATKKRKKKNIDSVIRSALRRCWRYSDSRKDTLKRDENTCQHCHKVKSKEVKIVVHHTQPPPWGELIADVKAKLFQTPDTLITLCTDCHREVHKHAKKS